jgi:hypothetical protein
MILCLNCDEKLEEESEVYFDEYEIHAKAYICKCGGEYMTSKQLNDLLDKIKKE